MDVREVKTTSLVVTIDINYTRVNKLADPWDTPQEGVTSPVQGTKSGFPDGFESFIDFQNHTQRFKMGR
jgi:hypothetical protein